MIKLILLLLFYAGFLGVWSWSGSQLPDRVATHFNASGEANGWMSRSGNQTFMLIFGLAVPLFLVGLCFATRFLPSSLINVPHRQYWLAPERKQKTSNYLARHSLWLACLTVGFMAAMEYSIVLANRQTPPHLSMALLLEVLGPFLAGTVVWIVVLLRHFRRLPDE